MKVYGLSEPLTGSELVAIQQVQGGNLAACSATTSQIAALAASANFASLPTTPPAIPGITWNNGGLICLS